MNSEKEIIDSMLAQFPACIGHLNRFFESDAEHLEPGKGNLLFTTDEFSAEDFFNDEDPALLGWNLAACTISDILASGGHPQYFGHSLTIARSWDKIFVECFAQGIAKALIAAGAGFVGGDLSISDQWKYTGICLGFSQAPLKRKGAQPGDKIYITGQVGAGNLLAAMKLYPAGEDRSGIKDVRFPVRKEESELINKFARACIDTSDGLLNALNTLAVINGVGYHVQQIPYLPDGIKICELLGKTKTFLFAGECGEYELLFTVSKAKERTLLEKARQENITLTCLGECTAIQHMVLQEDNNTFNFIDFDISARAYHSIDEYLSELTKYIAQIGRPE